MHTDVRGLPLTTGNAAAAEAYNRAIDAYFEYRLSAANLAKQAVEADPGFALAHCFRGTMFMLFGSTAVHGRARAALAEARAHEAGVSTREAAHLSALESWLSGDMTRTCAIWEDILAEHPRDLLALRLHHFAYFWMGRADKLRDGPTRVLSAWDETVPGYCNVLGMHAFGLEECGEYADAEALGRRAVGLNPEDLWGVHGVAHVLEMTGRFEDGLQWMNYPSDAWDDRNPFRGHLWWHRALFLLESGDRAGALALYDSAIRPEPSDFYLDIQNAAALLRRLTFLGMDVGTRWDDLADQVETRLDDHALAFTDAHAMIALAAAGRRGAARKLLQSLDTFAERPEDTAARTMRPVTIPLCEGILAHGDGEFARAAELLVSLLPGLAIIGGSHAQREVFELFAIHAVLRAGRLEQARDLMEARACRKPRSRDAWTAYGDLLETLGDHDGAAKAHARTQVRNI